MYVCECVVNLCYLTQALRSRVDSDDRSLTFLGQSVETRWYEPLAKENYVVEDVQYH